jgi:hypothetical protein
MVRCSAPSLVLVAALAAAYVGAQASAPGLESDECVMPLPRTPTPPPIMTLRTRDHEVALYGGDPPAFTVLDRHGMVLAERIDTDAFAERFPELNEQLRSAFAVGAWIDATAELPRREISAAAP